MHLAWHCTKQHNANLVADLKMSQADVSIQHKKKNKQKKLVSGVLNYNTTLNYLGTL